MIPANDIALIAKTAAGPASATTHATDRRSDGSGSITRDAAQHRDGRYLLTRDNLGLNRLPVGSGERRGATNGHGEHQQ